MESPEKPKERPSRIRAWLKRWWPVLLTIGIIVLGGILVWCRWGDAIWSWARGTGGAGGTPSGESPGETLRNISLTFGALAAFAIGPPLAVWRAIIVLEQTKIANEQAATAVRNLNNERYQKGAEMLGSDMLATRIGGIYALERLAREHPDEYHMQIIKLLCAFVRHSKVQGPSPSGQQKPAGKCPEDIDTAAQVIGRRSSGQIAIEHEANFRLNLRHSDLVNALLHQTNFSHVGFFDADFSHALLDDANFSFALLDGADFLTCALRLTNLSGADLTNVKNLTQADLDEAVIWEGSDPPILAGAIDPNTGQQLVWRGESVSLPRGFSATDMSRVGR